ncbi:hypothetical protein NSP_7810 [Nodularia spumigena CCY9414]|nr:hypothetical protein NSP_7810 [Nodularia spumigena CCY9414]
MSNWRLTQGNPTSLPGLGVKYLLLTITPIFRVKIVME